MSAPDRDARISLIGLPYHFGEPPRPTGYQMARGPHTLLAEDATPALLGQRFDDVTKVWIDDADDPDERDYGNDIRLLPPGDQMIRQLVQSRRLSEAVRDALAEDRFPAVSAGNCHTSIGMVAGIDDDTIGMIWFDAHADAGTPETSTNGMFEGMPVAVIAGLCWKRYRENLPGFHVIPQDRIITVGNHEVHSATARKRKPGGEALGRVVDPPVIAEHGFEKAITDAVDDLATRTSRVYVHIDTDVIDNRIAWANRHASDGGLTPENVVQAIRIIAERLDIAAVNFTAYDPTVDPSSPDVFIPLMADVVEVAATTTRRAAVLPS